MRTQLCSESTNSRIHNQRRDNPTHEQPDQTGAEPGDPITRPLRSQRSVPNLHASEKRNDSKMLQAAMVPKRTGAGGPSGFPSAGPAGPRSDRPHTSPKQNRRTSLRRNSETTNSQRDKKSRSHAAPARRARMGPRRSHGDASPPDAIILKIGGACVRRAQRTQIANTPQTKR